MRGGEKVSKDASKPTVLGCAPAEAAEVHPAASFEHQPARYSGKSQV